MRDATEPLAHRIASALADRRPQPSRDFESRLERATERSRVSLVTGLLAVAAVACAILIVVMMRPGPTARGTHTVQPPPSAPAAPPPTTTLPHDGRYSIDQCGHCHRPPPLAIHQPDGDVPLVDGHRSIACAKCHVAGKAIQRECSSCHADPHRGARGARCSDCHPAGSWKVK